MKQIIKESKTVIIKKVKASCDSCGKEINLSCYKCCFCKKDLCNKCYKCINFPSGGRTICSECFIISKPFLKIFKKKLSDFQTDIKDLRNTLREKELEHFKDMKIEEKECIEIIKSKSGKIN